MPFDDDAGHELTPAEMKWTLERYHAAACLEPLIELLVEVWPVLGRAGGGGGEGGLKMKEGG